MVARAAIGVRCDTPTEAYREWQQHVQNHNSRHELGCSVQPLQVPPLMPQTESYPVGVTPQNLVCVRQAPQELTTCAPQEYPVEEPVDSTRPSRPPIGLNGLAKLLSNEWLIIPV